MKKIINIYEHDHLDYDAKDVPYIITNYFINRMVSFLAICNGLYTNVAIDVCDVMEIRSWNRSGWTKFKKMLIDKVITNSNLKSMASVDTIKDIDKYIIDKVQKIIDIKNQKKSLQFKINNELLKDLNLIISI